MDEAVIRVSELMSKEVGMLQKVFAHAYMDAATNFDLRTNVILDIYDINYVLFALEQYQKALQEVIKDGQNKEQ